MGTMVMWVWLVLNGNAGFVTPHEATLHYWRTFRALRHRVEWFECFLLAHCKRRAGAKWWKWTRHQSFWQNQRLQPMLQYSLQNANGFCWVFLMMSISSWRFCCSNIPAPFFPYKPTAWTSSTYVSASCFFANAMIFWIGATVPLIEYTDSKQWFLSWVEGIALKFLPRSVQHHYA